MTDGFRALKTQSDEAQEYDAEDRRNRAISAKRVAKYHTSEARLAGRATGTTTTLSAQPHRGDRPDHRRHDQDPDRNRDR
jgi:hypothetical protein